MAKTIENTREYDSTNGHEIVSDTGFFLTHTGFARYRIPVEQMNDTHNTANDIVIGFDGSNPEFRVNIYHSRENSLI
jgi:hypothetical protein